RAGARWPRRWGPLRDRRARAGRPAPRRSPGWWRRSRGGFQGRPLDARAEAFQVALVDHLLRHRVPLAVESVVVAAHRGDQPVLAGELLIDRDLLWLMAPGVDLESVHQRQTLFHHVLAGHHP